MTYVEEEKNLVHDIHDEGVVWTIEFMNVHEGKNVWVTLRWVVERQKNASHVVRESHLPSLTFLFKLTC
jgi:hypothetical protein